MAKIVLDEYKTKFETVGPKLVAYLEESQKKEKERKLVKLPPEDEPIYPCQRDAVLNTKEKAERPENNCKPMLIVAPTGSGKTGIAVMLAYALQCKKVFVLTPSMIIGEQIAKSFGNKGYASSFFGLTGIIEDSPGLLEPVLLVRGKFDPSDNLPNVVIVNAQKFSGKAENTLSMQYRNATAVENVRKSFEQSTLLIVDEAHHYPAETWYKIIQEYQQSRLPGTKGYIIFLTATPYRNGQPILGANQDWLTAFSIDSSELYGKTIRHTIFHEKHGHADFDTVGRDIADYLERQKKSEPGFQPQAMVIVQQKDEAIRWAEGLNDLKKDESFAVAIIGDKNGLSNTAAFSSGKYQVSVVCKLLLEGYDNSKVTLCVILRKIGSRVLFDQFIGRCMRLNRDLGGRKDESVGVIISYKEFGQQKMWNERHEIAEVDPFDEGIDANCIQPIAGTSRSVSSSESKLRRVQFIEKSSIATHASVARDICHFLDAQKTGEVPQFDPRGLVLVPNKKDAAEWADGLNKAMNNPNFAVELVGGSSKKKSKEEYRVGVVCAAPPGGNAGVTLCVIVRKLGAEKLFNEFTGLCVQPKDNLSGGGDKSVGIVLSYKEFGQQKTFRQKDWQADDVSDGESPGEDQSTSGKRKTKECVGKKPAKRLDLSKE